MLIKHYKLIGVLKNAEIYRMFKNSKVVVVILGKQTVFLCVNERKLQGCPPHINQLGSSTKYQVILNISIKRVHPVYVKVLLILYFMR